MADDAAGLWYYEHRGARHGPVSIDRLRALLVNGEVAHNSPVWSEGFSEAVPADRVPQLCFLEDVDQILSAIEHLCGPSREFLREYSQSRFSTSVQRRSRWTTSERPTTPGLQLTAMQVK